MTATTSTPVRAGRPADSTDESTLLAPDPDDAREQIEVAVMMANGRLAPRSFASRADAEAWAQEGEQVVEFNLVCACDM